MAKTKARKSGGRPSLKTEALVRAIVTRLAKGEPMAQICRDDGMPHPSTIRDWMETDPAVSLAIARAREDGEDALAAECLEIADDSRNDWMERKAEEGDEKAGQFNGEHVQRSRLRIDTRLKLLAKWNPKKYGDKVQLADSDGNNLPAPQFIVNPTQPAAWAEPDA